MKTYSEEKMKLAQDKNLVHKLHILTYAGTFQMNAEECSQLADMIIRLERRGKTNDKT